MRSVALILALSFSLLSVSRSRAQETTGNIEGRLVDETGEPVSFANINVSSPSLQGGRGVMSTSDGYFGIFKLPVGVYTVKIFHVSYHQFTYEAVSVRLGRTTSLGVVALTPKVYEAPAVEVTERKPLIDPQSTTIGGNLSTQEFQALPLQRDYQMMPALLPHANESYLGDAVNFAGGTGQETRYFVDGADMTDPYASVSGTRLPYNFLKDIEVRTGGYGAEYRSSLGGTVNVVSHSGGNEFHGQVFGFFQNNSFARKPRLSFNDPPETEFTEYDVGLSLGGPIKRDKVWFFAAYNPALRSEDVEILGAGFFEDKSVRHIFAGKIDWRATKRTSVKLSVVGDPGNRDGVTGGTALPDNPDPFLFTEKTGSVNATVSGTHLFSDKFMLEGSVCRLQRKNEKDGATERGRNELAFGDRETGIASGGYPDYWSIKSVQTTAEVKGTFILGDHTIKLGGAYRDNGLEYREDYHILTRDDDTTYVETRFITTDGSVHNRIPSAFIQDSWRISNRITVNAGLRWDGQFWVASNGDVAQSITDQFQPRVGFVYQPGRLGSQKITGSFGRFYQDIGTLLLNFFYNEYHKYYFIEYDHDPRVDPSGGVVLDAGGSRIHPEVDGLKGQYFDEFTLGYERQISNRFLLGARGMYRVMRDGIEDGYVEELDEFRIGNPGRGNLSDFPRVKREYRALELSAQVFGGDRYNARASYVLSRNEGNYSGLYDSEYLSSDWANYTVNFDLPEMLVNGYGLLPNDRTHVFKLSGFYRVGYGFTAGTTFIWQSGTPLSVLEGSTWGDSWWNFAVERGSAGRTPSIWDLNLRFVYDISHVVDMSLRPRLILDLFHLGNQRDPVDYAEVKYFNQDDNGNQINPNPKYGQPTRFFPPAAARVGLEVNF